MLILSFGWLFVGFVLLFLKCSEVKGRQLWDVGGSNYLAYPNVHRLFSYGMIFWLVCSPWKGNIYMFFQNLLYTIVCICILSTSVEDTQKSVFLWKTHFNWSILKRPDFILIFQYWVKNLTKWYKVNHSRDNHSQAITSHQQINA